MNKMMQLSALAGMLAMAGNVDYESYGQGSPPKKGKRSAAQKRKRRQAKQSRKINRQRGT